MSSHSSDAKPASDVLPGAAEGFDPALLERRALPAEAKEKLIAAVGPRGYLDRPEDLKLYEYDGSIDKARPELVVFPRTTEEVAAIVKITAQHGVPIVGRGAGTGLSGGAIPRAGGVTIG